MRKWDIDKWNKHTHTERGGFALLLDVIGATQGLAFGNLIGSASGYLHRLRELLPSARTGGGFEHHQSWLTRRLLGRMFGAPLHIILYVLGLQSYNTGTTSIPISLKLRPLCLFFWATCSSCVSRACSLAVFA